MKDFILLDLPDDYTSTSAIKIVSLHNEKNKGISNGIVGVIYFRYFL